MNFVAFERAKQGTGASRRLRNSGKTPASFMAPAKNPGHRGGPQRPVARPEKEVFHSSVLDMDLNGQVSKVVLRDVQYHPFKQLVLHVDFQRVDEKTKVHLKVPLHFTGADESNAVKVDKCTVTPLVSELDVTCMPADLPEFINVDLSGLQRAAHCTCATSSCPRTWWL